MSDEPVAEIVIDHPGWDAVSGVGARCLEAIS